MNKNDQSTNEITDDIRDLVLARIDSLPETIEISVGGQEHLSKGDMLEHIKSGDELGVAIIESQMEFLKSLKDGSLYEQAHSGHAA